MEIYLIRHAQSCNNARPESEREADPGLTEIGKQQAERLAQHLVEHELDELYTSPFRRTLETSAAIQATTGLNPRIRTELHEQGGCYSGFESIGRVGESGLTRTQIERHFPDFSIDSVLDESGWWQGKPYESLDEARFRAEWLLAQTLEEFSHLTGRVGFVMHADIKKLFLNCFHGEPLEMPYNSSVTQIDVSPSGCQMLRYNCVDHLPSSLLTF